MCTISFSTHVVCTFSDCFTPCMHTVRNIQRKASYRSRAWCSFSIFLSRRHIKHPGVHEKKQNKRAALSTKCNGESIDTLLKSSTYFWFLTVFSQNTKESKLFPKFSLNVSAILLLVFQGHPCLLLSSRLRFMASTPSSDFLETFHYFRLLDTGFSVGSIFSPTIKPSWPVYILRRGTRVVQTKYHFHENLQICTRI